MIDDIVAAMGWSPGAVAATPATVPLRVR